MKNLFLFLVFSTVIFGQTLPNVQKSGGASADNTVPRYDGTTGRIIKNSGVVIDDDNNVIANNISNTTLNPTGNTLISGGGVDFVSGLQFTVGAATYRIGSTIYSSPITTLTAAAADPTNPRIDIVAVNSSGAAVIIEGTPASNPVAPDVDPTTQLALTFYILPATATVLPVTVNDIYHENTEWTTSKVGAPINLASTNNPYRGTVDIEGTAAVAGNSFTFTAPSTFDPGTYATLFFYVAPKAAWANPKQFSVQLLNSSGVAIGQIVTFKSGTFGFNSGGTANAYQQVAIPVSLFGANGQTAKGLKFTLAGGGSSIGFYMDDFTLQAGLSPTLPSNAMVWRGAYSATTAYNVNDVVTSGPGATLYVAIAAGTGNTPASSATFWQVAGNPGTVTNLTGPITSVGNATSVASQTGTGSTFVMNTAPTISTPTLSGTTTQTGTTILTPAPMAAFVIDVAQRLNTKTVSTAPTFTFSGTPSVGQWFGLEVSNGTAGDLTCTIPTSTLVNSSPGGTTTSVTLPASGKLNLAWRYDGSVYNLYTGGTSGTGTVTHTGNLTSNAVVLGNGTADTKVVAGVTTDGTSVLNLGVAGTSVGKMALANATSGSVTIQPATGALGSAVLTAPAHTATLLDTATVADTMQAAQLVTLTSSGTDTYAGTAGVTATAYTTGTHYTFTANTANTGAASLNVNGLGAKTIVKVVGGVTTTLADNDIRNGQVCDVAYDGTNFQLQSTLGNAGTGTGTVNSGTATQVAYYASTGTAVSSTPAFTIGATGAASMTCGGSNQSITITPTGTGYTHLGASAYALTSFNVYNDVIYPFAKTDTTARIAYFVGSNDASNPFGWNLVFTGSATPANRIISMGIGAIGSDTAGRFQMAMDKIEVRGSNSTQVGGYFSATPTGGTPTQFEVGSEIVNGQLVLTTNGTGEVRLSPGGASNTATVAVTAGNPGTTKFNGGISNNGSALKHARVTTGSITAGTSSVVTATWTTAFADTNYTVVASVADSTAAAAALRVVHIESIVAGSVGVRIENTSAGSITGTVDVIAIHD